MADNEPTRDRVKAKAAEIKQDIEAALAQIPPNSHDAVRQMTVNRALVVILAEALVRIEILENQRRG